MAAAFDLYAAMLAELEQRIEQKISAVKMREGDSVDEYAGKNFFHLEHAGFAKDVPATLDLV